MNHLKCHLEPDNNQFAYKAGRSTSDAVLCLTDHLTQHLDKSKDNYARCLFIDLSSAFNTVNPLKLENMLIEKDTDPEIVDWISSFLFGRKQFIDDGATTSNYKDTYRETPQGSVISPFLFSFYISDICSQEQKVGLIKYADDMVIYGLCGPGSSGEKEYLATIHQCVNSCNELDLILNKSKTKEMIISLAMKPPAKPEPLQIDGTTIDMVDEFKYLGTILTSNLSLERN